MKRLFSMALLAGLGVSLAATASAQHAVQRANYRSDKNAGANKLAAALQQLGGNVEKASCDSCDLPGASYGPEMGGLGMEEGGWGAPILAPATDTTQFFVGGEYLHVRASPSEAISHITRDLRDIANPTDNVNQFDYDYDSSFRVYAGCRNACGEELRFTYTRFDTDSDFVSPTVPNGSGGAFQIIAPLEVIATIDGSRVEGSSDIDLDSFDLGWSKTIPLGSPLSCDTGCGDVCGDACGDCCGTWCPAWDITFTGALRAADFSANRRYVAISPAEEMLTQGATDFDFEGFGGRVGMMGRRYFGRQGIASVYVKGDISLLVGNYSATQERISAATPGQVVEQSFSGRQVVPVTEIEAGGSVFVTSNTTLSSGYFISAWHDLGFRENYDFGLQTTYDDANIMGFDGWFVRLETAF